MSFSRDDFKIQSDLIKGKKIYSMKNPKFKNVHPVQVRQLAQEFNPAANNADRYILEHVSMKYGYFVPKMQNPNRVN